MFWKIICYILVLHKCLCKNEYRTVKVEQGEVRGFKSEDGSVINFYGIPYAKAPTGNDKFKAPLPPTKWQGILNATTKDVVCPQRPNNQISGKNNMTIDCLHINVFTPVDDYKDKKPVLMYIHGGAYKQGYGNEISPQDLIKRGIIVANVNYRVGVHGFLCLGTEFAPGNAALKDLVAALRWIQENIAQFGGDPNNVSIAGNSSGGALVEFLMLSKMAIGLFQKAVSESSSALSPWAVDEKPIETAEHYANQFGVNTNNNVALLEDFYKTLRADDFKITFNMTKFNVLGFAPCVEKKIVGVKTFLKETPIKIIRSGDYNKVPYMTGFTSMEGIYFLQFYNETKTLMEQDLSLFLPNDLEFSNESQMKEVVNKVKELYFPNGINYKNYVDFFTDITFAHAILTCAKLHRHNFNDLFVYMFSFNGTLKLPSFGFDPIEGPGHVVQSLYVQNFSYGIGYDKMKENDYLIQNRMITMWVNFYKYGYPIKTKDDLLPSKWLQFGEQENYLNIDVEMKLNSLPLHERAALWDDIYAKYRRTRH